jgi:CubicO group peptidase (beta-lactamase class C family)
MRKQYLIIISISLLLLRGSFTLEDSEQATSQDLEHDYWIINPENQEPSELEYSELPKSPLLNASILENYFNEYIPEQIQQYNIPGATILVCSNNSILYSKGYGYSDVDANILVDPAQTIFPMGSMSELFTWTALMQLYEQNILDLNKDIREYLVNTSIILTSQYNTSITTMNLMGHAAGFEDNVIGEEAMSSGTVLDLESYLAKHSPYQLYDPGTVMAYSNYGATLGGFLVELLTNQSFPEYINQNLFQPLNMSSSIFGNMHEINENLATGYIRNNDEIVETSPFYLNIIPAGGLFSTATDMSKFMQAQLNSGSYNNKSILSNETITFMHQPHFNMDTQSTGWAHGFMTKKFHNLTWIGHEGDISGYTSDLNLFLDDNFGIFITYNSGGQEDAREQLLFDFITEFFSLSEVQMLTSPNISRTDLRRFKGDYRTMRRVDSNIMRIYHLLTEDLSFSINSNGFLVLDDRITFAYISDLRFRAVDADYYIEFIEDEEGTILYVVCENVNTHAFMKVLFWNLQPIQRWWGILSTFFVLSGIVVPPLLVFKKKKNHIHPAPVDLDPMNSKDSIPEKGEEKRVNPNSGEKKPNRILSRAYKRKFSRIHLSAQSYRVSSLLSWMVSILMIIYLICLYFIFQELDWIKTGSSQGTIKFFLALALVARTIAFFNLILILNAWIDLQWNWKIRLYYTLLLINQLGLVLWLYFWKLFGFNL